jgi:protein TonB
VSDRSQSKVPIFVFVVGAILLGAAALLSVLVTVPSPGGHNPPVTADQNSQPKPGAAADKVEARLPLAKPAPSATTETVTEPVNTGALAGPGPGHTFEPLKDEMGPPSAGTATSEPAAPEPMSDADLAEIKAATRAAADVAAAEAPAVRPDEAERPGADADATEPIVTAAAPHAADAEEPETSAAEPHAPASLSGATTPPARDEAMETPSTPPPVEAAPGSAPALGKEEIASPDQNRGPEPATKAEPEPSQPTAMSPSAKATDDADAATSTPAAVTAKEPTATSPVAPEDTKPEPAKSETAEVAQPHVPSAAPEPDRASPTPVEAEPAPPMPSKKVVAAAPEVPKPVKAEAPSPPPVKAASKDKSDDKREATRSRQAEPTPQVETRTTESKPGMRPMALGFSGGLFKPKAVPAPRARGKSSRAYGAVVRGAVGRHRPRGVGRGRVIVTFSIGPMGALRGVSVARSSGNSKLDQAALSAVRSAAPFPAPPSGAGQTYSLPIYFH